MKLTSEQLKKCMPNIKDENIQKYLSFLNDAMEEFEINTPLRVAHFLAQLAHESFCLRYMEEIASGEAYEGRKDLGNVFPGDGKRYKGRGPIQLTGRNNYKVYGKELGLNLVDFPEKAKDPEVAFRIAALFWKKNGLNELADKQKFKSITKRINGGFNGYEDRLKYFELCHKTLVQN